MVKPLSPVERRTRGQQNRRQLPRSEHKQWNPRLRRHHPMDLLRHSLKGRLSRLFPLRYQLMAASPFGFFRGAVPVMAYDLSLLPHTGVFTQLSGDAHLRNLGAYAGIDGRLVFDINDFDETLHGPFEWDLKRLATSVLLAADAANLKGSVARDAVGHLLERYRLSMRLFAAMPALELLRYPVRRLDRLPAVSDILSKAERTTPLRSLDLLTEPIPSGKSHHPSSKKSRRSGATKTAAQSTSLNRRFRTDPPQLEPLSGSEADRVLASLRPYRRSLQPERRHTLDQYHPLEVAFKVVGTGSVGLRDFCVLLEGNGLDDPLFLQVKEEAPSAWAPYLDAAVPPHQGRRVVEGQRAMQLQSDPFLGWTSMDGRDFLVRQLNDHKGSLDLETLTGDQLVDIADLAGELFARSHARAGDPAALTGYIGKSSRFDDAILKFALAYAHQTERDWKQLVRARHF